MGSGLLSHDLSRGGRRGECEWCANLFPYPTTSVVVEGVESVSGAQTSSLIPRLESWWEA